MPAAYGTREYKDVGFLQSHSGILRGLEEARKTAERELRALQSQRESLEELERDKEALLERYEAISPEALDTLTPEERHRF